MNRREFFKLSLASGVVVAVSVASPALARNIAENSIGHLTQHISQRIDILGAPWQVYHKATIHGVDYETMSLYEDEPDEHTLIKSRRQAITAFMRKV